MLRWPGLATVAMAILALLFVACGDDDGDSPIRVGGSPGADARTGRAADGSSTAVSPAVTTPEPFAATCGREDVAPRYTGEGRLKSPALPSPAGPVASLASREDVGLERTIGLSLGDGAGAFGVMVVNLSDGRYAALNPDRSFYAASLFKLTVMYEVFRQREMGTLSFDETILYSPFYQKYDLAAAPMRVCSDVSVARAVEQMITVSENVSAVLLQDRVGAAAIDQDMAALGLGATTLGTGDVSTTPRDMARLLEIIARDRAVSPQASREMLGLLLRQTVRNRIPAGLPGGVSVANKTGDWENATHDVAIVLAPFGTYVIAVLSEQGSATPIAELSAAVYRYLATGELPPTPTPGASPDAAPAR